jgi:hypothetical protein
MIRVSPSRLVLPRHSLSPNQVRATELLRVVPNEKGATMMSPLLRGVGGGAPHIHGELLQLGLTIGETSVAKYMVRRRKPPSQTWRTFLNDHVQTLVSVDFFSAPQRRRSPVGEGPTQVDVGRT